MLDPLKELKQTPENKYRFIDSRYQRMRKIEDLIKTKAYKRIELARLFGVNRSTITRIIDEMSLVVPIREDKERRLYIDSF